MRTLSLALLSAILSSCFLACSGSGAKATSPALLPPSNLSAQVLHRGINITWDAVASADQYTIDWADTATGVGQSSSASTSDTSFLISGENGVELFYSVSAVRQGVKSVASQTFSATPSLPTSIAAPMLVLAEETSILVSFAQLEATSLSAAIREEGTTIWAQMPSSGTEHTFAGLDSETRYEIRMQYNDQSGALLSDVLTADTTPLVVENLSAEAGNEEATFSFSADTANFAYFLLYANSEAALASGGTRIGPISAPYRLRGLTNSQATFFRIEKHDAQGGVSRSTIRSTMPDQNLRNERLEFISGHTQSITANRLGDEIFAWYGRSFRAYNTVTKTTRILSTENAPLGKSYLASVAAGDKLVFWDGKAKSEAEPENKSGAIYDTLTDSWTRMSQIDQPNISYRDHAKGLFWTGSKILAIGLSFGPGQDSGAIYDLDTHTWTPIASAPTNMLGNFVKPLLAGEEVFFWGGFLGGDGLRYNILNNTWGTIAAPSADVSNDSASATKVWTGNRMIVHSSIIGSQSDIGAIYDPSTDSWSGEFRLSNSPIANRNPRTAIWTGTEFVLPVSATISSGTSLYFYDPATGSRDGSGLSPSNLHLFSHSDWHDGKFWNFSPYGHTPLEYDPTTLNWSQWNIRRGQAQIDRDAVHHNGKIYQYHEYLQEMLIFDALTLEEERLTFSEDPSAPHGQNLARLKAFRHGERIYYFTQRRQLNPSVHSYFDIATKSFVTTATPDIDEFRVGVSVKFGDQVYFYQEGPDEGAMIYDLTNDSWSYGAEDVNAPDAYPLAYSSDDSHIVVLDRDGNLDPARIHVCDLSTFTWSISAQAPSNFAGTGGQYTSQTKDGEFYAFGETAIRYNPTSDVLTTLLSSAPWQVAYNMRLSVLSGNRIYMHCDHRVVNDFFSKVGWFDLDTNTWHDIPFLDERMVTDVGPALFVEGDRLILGRSVYEIE